MAKTILVIDDDPEYRGLLRKKLGEEGYLIQEAINGEDALRVMEKNSVQIDLILLDLAMPLMDGITCYFRMKKKLGSNKHVIILTNLSASSYPSEIKDYIIKTDISLDNLVKKIKTYIG